jgi:hypothetical protein
MGGAVLNLCASRCGEGADSGNHGDEIVGSIKCGQPDTRTLSRFSIETLLHRVTCLAGKQERTITQNTISSDVF